jgi:hypothetical protein
MAGGTLTTFDAVLKTQYPGSLIEDQLNNKVLLLQRLEKDYDSVVGKNFTIPLHYGRNEGTGARADGGTLPTAGAQAYKECIVPMRYIYHRIKITGPTIKAARSNEGAFVRAVDSEMRGAERDMRSSLNRQLYGDGSAILATCASASTVNITVDSTAKLRVNMPVDILVTATGATTAGVLATTVVSITSATVFVVADAPGTPASIDNTYSVYLSKSRNLENMGLSGIVAATDPAAGALQGLAVATYPWWKANVLGNSAVLRPISEVLLQTAIDTTEQNSSGNASAMYTTYGVRRAYQALLTASKSYTSPTELKGGYKALDYNGLPLIADKDCPANKLFLPDESKLKIYRLSDTEWMDDDGAILSRVSGEDAYEAVLYLYQELGCHERNAMTLISDITEA